MKKSIIVFFILIAMFNVAWCKPQEKMELEEFRFFTLTSDSISYALLYKHLENKELSDKYGLIILTIIETQLMTINGMLLSKNINNDINNSSIYTEIKSNNSILVKLITSPPILKSKYRTLLKTLTYLLLLPISAQDKELVLRFMKENYSKMEISTENDKALSMLDFGYNLVSSSFEKSLFVNISLLQDYTHLLRIFSLFRDGKVSEIKCILRNKIIYNHILISLFIKRNAGYDKASYVKYKKNLVIQDIINDYKRKKTKKDLKNPENMKVKKQIPVSPQG